MKSDYVSLWYTQFRKLRASKGGGLLLCNDTEFDLHLVILNTLHWQLPFHSTLVIRRLYLGHDNWRQRYRFFSHYKVPLTFRYSWKRLRKRRTKKLIKFPQVYIEFVLQYIHCFEKNDRYWLNESWEIRLPKRLKCAVSADISDISRPNTHTIRPVWHQLCLRIPAEQAESIAYTWASFHYHSKKPSYYTHTLIQRTTVKGATLKITIQL